MDGSTRTGGKKRTCRQKLQRTNQKVTQMGLENTEQGLENMKQQQETQLEVSGIKRTHGS